MTEVHWRIATDAPADDLIGESGSAIVIRKRRGSGRSHQKFGGKIMEAGG
nr:hypothetical protein [Burkholderia ambifaria]